MALELALFPAILMALASRELGSITNLYVTPVTRVEFLGQQLPYVAVAMVNFIDVCDGAARLQSAAQGKLSTLVLGTLIYVSATTAYGMLTYFARTRLRHSSAF